MCLSTPPAGGAYSLARTFALGHKEGLGLAVKPETGELAVSPDGTRLLVANFQNDSVSLIDLASGQIAEQDLRPGAIDAARRGQPGGSFPRAVVWVSDDKAYVTSERDREIIALRIAGGRIAVAQRVRTRGQPIALARNPSGSRLYVATDDTDGLIVLDTATDRAIERASTLAPAAVRPASARGLGGAGSNGLALAPDGRTLLVTNGAENDVAVVRLSAAAAGVAAPPREDADGDGDDDDRAGAAKRPLVGDRAHPNRMVSDRRRHGGGRRANLRRQRQEQHRPGPRRLPRQPRDRSRPRQRLQGDQRVRLAKGGRRLPHAFRRLRRPSSAGSRARRRRTTAISRRPIRPMRRRSPSCASTSIT